MRQPVGIILMILGVIVFGRAAWLQFEPGSSQDKGRTLANAAVGVALILAGAVVSAE